MAARRGHFVHGTISRGHPPSYLACGTLVEHQDAEVIDGVVVVPRHYAAIRQEALAVDQRSDCSQSWPADIGPE